MTGVVGAATGWKWDTVKSKTPMRMRLFLCKRAAFRALGMLTSAIAAPVGVVLGMASNHVQKMRQKMSRAKTVLMVGVVAAGLTINLIPTIYHKLSQRR